jgi:hypothetical protein
MMLQEQRSHDSVVDNIGTVGSNGHEAPDQEDALQELKTIVMYHRYVLLFVVDKILLSSLI